MTFADRNGLSENHRGQNGWGHRSDASSEDTAPKLSRTRGLKPFKKGSDPRRNTRGRPKNFDELRRLSQRIGAEQTTDKQGKVMTRIECVLRKLAASSDPQALRIFLEYGFGKPLDRVEVDGLQHKTVLRLYYAHERPELQQSDGPSIAVNGEGTRSRLLPGAE